LNEHTTHLSKIPASVSSLSVVPESAEEITVSLLSEQKEKEKCQLSIIVHKLEESTARDKKQDDIKRCEALFQSYLGTKVIIKNAICLVKQIIKLSLSNIKRKS